MIAAKRKGFDVFGVDVNPYCKIIADAKLACPRTESISAIKQFLADLPDVLPAVSLEKLPPLSEYFPRQNLIDLLSIKEIIKEKATGEIEQLLNAAWYFILEDSSNRKKDGNGLATRPSPVKNVRDYYVKTVEDMLADCSDHPFVSESISEVFIGSAINFSNYSASFQKQSDKQLGAVIFSPPYANAFDYYESYKMELLFSEQYSMEEYQAHKKEQIRNYRISYGKKIECDIPIVEKICNEIDIAIPEKERKLGKKMQ